MRATIYLLFVAATPLLIAGLFVGRGAARQAKARSIPITSLDAFQRCLPEPMPGVAVRPRLTVKGQTLVSFVCVFGALGIVLTCLVLYALARNPQWAGAAALLPCVGINVAVALVVRILKRDHTLVKKGRLIRGRVIALLRSGDNGIAYYDFPDDLGGVTRGRSTLSARTPESAYWQTAVGSGVDVLYLPGSSQRNALSLSLCWET